jgi:hypothetical protein
MRNMVAVPNVGWNLACAACGRNLTSYYGEYEAWHGDAAPPSNAGIDEDVEGWNGEECPECGVPLGGSDDDE